MFIERVTVYRKISLSLTTVMSRIYIISSSRRREQMTAFMLRLKREKRRPGYKI